MEKGGIIITYAIAIGFLAWAVWGFVNNNIGAIVIGCIACITFLAYAVFYTRMEMTASRLRKNGIDEDIIREYTETYSDRKIREMEEYKKAHGLTFFAEHTMYEKEKGKCPKCGAFVGYDGRIVCIDCGTVILRDEKKQTVDDSIGSEEDVLTPYVPENDHFKDQITECPYCNTSLGTIRGDFCPHCGKKLG